MNHADKNFYTLCRFILESGNSTLGEKVRPSYADGTPSHTYFTTQIFETYDLSKGDFPITTLRPIPWKSAIKEIFWIYQDQSNDLNLLADKYNITWWDEWDIGDRTIGQRYGATVKRYDLMNTLLQGLKDQPLGRRHIINLYQYADFQETKGLHPCAMETHWAVRGQFLDLTLIQRSSDIPVANAINKVQYVALQMMVAKHVGLQVGRFCHYVHNAHIYDRHTNQINELLYRFENGSPLEAEPSFLDALKIIDPHHEDFHRNHFDPALQQSNVPQPMLYLNPEKKDFYSILPSDFTLENYNPIKPNLTFEMAI